MNSDWIAKNVSLIAGDVLRRGDGRDSEDPRLANSLHTAAARPTSGLRPAFWIIETLVLLVLLAGSIDSFSADRSSPGRAELVASPEPGWPQWRGPRRDGISTETGLLTSWPEGGPKLLWKTDGVGFGYSSPIISGDRMFLTGDVNQELHIIALDLAGRRIWTATNGFGWKDPYPGARASCAYRDGRLFHLNARGRLAALDAASGRELWSVNVLERFKGKNITWALSECLLVDGNRVIVTAGGTEALMAALDVTTGATIWASEPLQLGPSDRPQHQRLPDPSGETDSASYASPILFTVDGRRMLVGCSNRHVFGVDADSGKLLWTRPLKTRYSVIAATPVLVGDAIFVTAPDTEDARLYRIRVVNESVEVDTVWTTRLDSGQGGAIYQDGSILGPWYRRGKGWACVDSGTGAVRYQTDALAKGSAIFADGRLYCLSEEGDMVLLRPGASAFHFDGRFRLVPPGKNDVWAHPVILDGRLYLRYHDTLYCYDIRKR